jgi:hypothetical protein
MMLTDSSSQSAPLSPFDEPITSLASATGASGLGAVTATGAGLQVSADASGLTITPEASFAGWVRVTVTREFDDGSDDSYTVAVADFLTGSNTNLQGAGLTDSQISTVRENYQFDNSLTLAQFLGTGSATAFNTGTQAERRTALENQQTNWLVTYPAMGTNGSLPVGASLPEMAITDSGKPAATYPGATSGKALKVTFSAPAQQGFLMSHKGIPVDQYDPGDLITFSINTYFNLAYDGLHDDLINEPTSGLAFALALTTLPLGLVQNVNYLYFPPTQAAMAPLRRGGGGLVYGRGGSQAVNPFPLLHGQWTRQEVSLRAPQTGQNVQGPSGSGNTLDAVGLGAMLLLLRSDASTSLPGQTVWLDNLCITRCPSALAMTCGATNVPMVSAGFALAFNNGNDSGPGAAFVAPGFYGDIPIPQAITRGQIINGNFSRGSGGVESFTALSPASVFGIPTTGPHSQSVNNARAGWLEAAGVTDLAMIGTGGNDMALLFPELSSGHRSLVIGPAPNSITGNPWGSNLEPSGGHSGRAEVQTPYLDMRLSSNAVLPGLRVEDETFPGTGGNPNGLNGYLNPKQILGNVSGVFGVRWFVRSNAAQVNHNPRLDVLFINGDFLLGLVAGRSSASLPSQDNAGFPLSPVWVDDILSGSMLTFNSYQAYYDLLLNSQAGGRAGITGEVPAGLLSSLQSDNPGAQMARVVFMKGNDQSSGASVGTIAGNATLNGFKGIYSPAGQPVTNTDRLPGRYSSAVLAIDEVNLYAVRDSEAFYDEEMQ